MIYDVQKFRCKILFVAKNGVSEEIIVKVVCDILFYLQKTFAAISFHKYMETWKWTVMFPYLLSFPLPSFHISPCFFLSHILHADGYRKRHILSTWEIHLNIP